MRGAPSVTCPVGRSRFAALLALVLWSGGIALALRAGAAAEGFGWRQALLAGSVLATGAVGAWSWWSAAQGRLLWDGGRWLFRGSVGAEQAGHVSVALDLQRCMLLRFVETAGGRTSWLWVDASRCAADCWHGLRCAVHSSRVAGGSADVSSAQPDRP